MEKNAVYAGVARDLLPPQVVTTLAYDTLKGLIAEIHPPTAEHSIKVRMYAMLIGQAMGLPGSDLNVLSIAAEVHDIGKVFVPKQILNNTGKLSESDWQLIKQHPLWGASKAERSFPSMPNVVACVKLHHERLDGSGYPHGVAGCQIPYMARIIAVADAFAALTEDRPYRHAYTDLGALHVLIVDESGRYDDQSLSALERCVSSGKRIDYGESIH